MALQGYYKFLQIGFYLSVIQYELISLPVYVNRYYQGQRTPRESFFSKIRNFWAWAD